MSLIPRAAVSIAVRYSIPKGKGKGLGFHHNNNNNNKGDDDNDDDSDSIAMYALVRRKNPPHAGMWSIPGGKIQWGEPTMQAARRELSEETGLVGLAVTSSGGRGSLENDMILDSQAQAQQENENTFFFKLKWYQDPFCCTDSIHFYHGRPDEILHIREKQIRYHYIIAQCFAQVTLVEKKNKRSSNSKSNSNSNSNSNLLSSHPHENEEIILPKLFANDDALEARWFSTDEIKRYVSKGSLTKGVHQVIFRAEELYNHGLFNDG